MLKKIRKELMNKINVALIFSLCLQFIIKTSFGQVFSDDIKAMNTYYQSQQQFQMKVKVEVFSGENKSVPVGFNGATINKFDGKFLYGLGVKEMLLTEKELIIIDHSDKVMLYRSISKQEYESIQKQYYTQQLDSVIQQYDSVRFDKVKDGRKIYTIYYSKNQISKTQLVLDEKENYIRELTYYYNPKINKNISKIVIVFSTTTSLTENAFSEKRFIVREGKRIKPSLKFLDYDFKNIDEF